MFMLHHELEKHHHLMEAPLVFCRGEGSVRRSWAWSQEGTRKWGRGSLSLTCLVVADVTQEQGLLEPLLVDEDIPKGIFVIEFLEVMC